MNTNLQLFRKRHIPEECIPLKNDSVLFLDASRMVTAWNVLKPRSDFASGISLFDFEKHWKITREYCLRQRLLYLRKERKRGYRIRAY